MKQIIPVQYLLSFLFAALLTCSCNKLIDVTQPNNTLTSDKVFADESTAKAALTGLYIQQMNSGLSFGNSLITITAGLSADELKLGAVTPVYNEFFTNNLGPSNNYVSSMWSNPYARIYQCNSLIEKSAGNARLSISLQNQIVGEAKFCRAFFYFYLLQLFGDVPLVLSSDYTKTTSIARTPEGEVYEQILADLEDAVRLLPAEFPNGKTSPGKWAAKALMARVFLYQKNWPAALKTSDEVISSGVFKLEDSLTTVFLPNSQEAIWQLAPVDGMAYTWEGSYFIPRSNAAPSYPLNDNFYSSFEINDLRKQNWTGNKIVAAKEYPFANKYRVSSGTGIAKEYYMVLRLAEQYLIRSEASTYAGITTDALKDLDQVRKRASLTLYSTDGLTHTKEEVLLLIEKERQHELFCEWGHRWFDLNRTGRTLPVLLVTKSAVKASATKFPIPFNQIQYNPALTQNLGY